MNILKPVSIACETSAKFAKSLGKRLIVETKPQTIHGINPTLTYKPTGVTIEMPRFCSVEMQQARKMNKIAINEAKSGVRDYTYPKATPEDLKRLTSQTIEDSYARVIWTNPKNGKVYHILKEKELESGDVLVRILNEDGSFLKDARITPKRIVIIDSLTSKTEYGLPHGTVVEIFAKRHNPFAKIEYINVSYADPNCPEYMARIEELLNRIKNGEKIDFLSCSNGVICETTSKEFRHMPASPLELISQLGKQGKTRILYSSGNYPKNPKGTTNQVLLMTPNVEGVGSISPKTGKISEFSASRNSYFTQHYEVGEHSIIPTEYGANITGLPGTDIVIDNPEFIREVQRNSIAGKTKAEVDSMLKDIEEELKQVMQKRLIIFRDKSFTDKMRELNELEEKVLELRNKKSQLIQSIGSLKLNSEGYYIGKTMVGTSFSTPIRTAKLALNDMLEGII